MEILFLKNIDKGALKCSVDVKIPKWGNFIIRRIKVFQKGSDSWISLPSETYEKDGQQKYFALNTFEDPVVLKNFEGELLKKIKDYKPESQTVKVSPMPPSKSNVEEVELLYMKLLVDIELKSEANLREFWATRMRRHHSQSFLVRQAFKETGSITLPVQIILTRISPRKLDTDNLLMAFKNIRDEVADIIIPGKKRGRADDSSQIRWFYNQRKPEKNATKKQQIEIEIIQLKS